MSKTTVFCWPSCQLLMDLPGFHRNAALCASSRMYGKYGDSAYAVNQEWLERQDPETTSRALSMQQTYEGPEVDFSVRKEFLQI